MTILSGITNVTNKSLFKFSWMCKKLHKLFRTYGAMILQGGLFSVINVMSLWD